MNKQSKPHIIQSHRGAGKLGPENTLESFELGWKIGTIPEADVWQTSDGIMFAFHDSTLDRQVVDLPSRLSGVSLKDLAWRDIASLDAGAYRGSEFKGQKIPEMAAVFEVMRGKPERLLYMDVRNASLDRLAELARKSGVLEQTILASTDYGVIREWKRVAPESSTLLWMGAPEEKLRERMAELREAGFEALTQLQIHVHVGDLGADEPLKPSPEFLKSVGEEIKPRGILFQVLIIGTDTVEAYHRLMDLGVESFATDDPEVALLALKDA